MHLPRITHPFVATLAALALASAATGQEPAPAKASLPSTVWDWNELAVNNTFVGTRRDVHDGPTATLERFECHVSTLYPGKTSHPPHQHAQEEFIILQDGTLDVGINGVVQRIGAGSLFFFATNDWHNVNNAGEEPATYLVFNVATAATRSAPASEAAKSAPPGTLASQVFDWSKMESKPTETGERREVFAGPSVTCREIECDIITLRPGEAAHQAQKSPAEQVIVVKDGTLETTIEGRVESVGRGSIVFVASNDEHAFRNAGSTPATYYAVRVVSDRTPAIP